MKIKAPGTFDGNCTKLNSFLSKCDLYMAYYKPKDDQEKIFFLLYHIEGKAEKWRDNIWKEWEKNPAKYPTYNDFVTQLKKDWGPIDEPGVVMHLDIPGPVRSGFFAFLGRTETGPVPRCPRYQKDRNRTA